MRIDKKKRHLIYYDPPEGYIGYGLKVLGQYDYGENIWLGYSNKEGEWYIAYHAHHATPGIVGQKIREGEFKAGVGQACHNHNNINELTKNKYGKLGIGVYYYLHLETIINQLLLEEIVIILFLCID